jgi:hypothetical protein
MMVDVPTEPPRLLVRVLPDEERELDVERLVTARLVAVAETDVRLLDVRLLEITRLVPVALVKKRLVIVPVTAERRDEKKLVEVALVTERLEDWRLLVLSVDTVVVASVDVPVTVSVVPVALVKRRLVKEESADTTREAIVVVPVNVLSPANV